MNLKKAEEQGLLTRERRPKIVTSLWKLEQLQQSGAILPPPLHIELCLFHLLTLFNSLNAK
jgi:hypothetical protein